MLHNTLPISTHPAATTINPHSLVSVSSGYDQANSFCKILVAVGAMYVNPLPKLVAKKIGLYLDNALGFAQQNGLNTSTLQTIVQHIVRGKDVEHDDLHNAVVDLAHELAENKKLIEAETKIHRNHVSFVKDFCLWMLKDSSAAYKRMDKNSQLLQDPVISSIFSNKEIASQDTIKDQLIKMVKRLGGTGTNLDVNQRKAQAIKNNVLYKEFLSLRRTYIQAYKEFLQQYVRASGSKLVKISELLTVLKREQIEHTIPSGFIGQIDEQGSLYTLEGLKLVSNPSYIVEMNPEYNGKKDNTYVCSGLPYKGAPKPVIYYTTAYRMARSADKFDVVQDLSKEAPALRKKWLAKIKDDVDDRTSVKACMLELSYLTTARVGSKVGNTGGETTYGLSTLRSKHIKLEPSRIIFTYKGKDGVRQRHVVHQNDSPKFKQIYSTLQQLVDKAPKDDGVFRVQARKIISTELNKFIVSLGAPEGTTIHKFRHLRAYVMTNEILERNPFSKRRNVTEKEVTDWLKKQLLMVGKQLGHISGDKVTANTAIGAYISPVTLAQFYKNLGLRIPKYVEKLLHSKQDD